MADTDLVYIDPLLYDDKRAAWPTVSVQYPQLGTPPLCGHAEYFSARHLPEFTTSGHLNPPGLLQPWGAKAGGPTMRNVEVWLLWPHRRP